MVLLNPQTLKALNRAPAQAFPFTIAETTGDARVLTLRGRSLPYRGVSWGQEQRVEIKYFPGNPVAQAQVLGPTWTDTTIRGMWKDTFLYNDDSKATLVNFPAIASAGRPNSTDFADVGGRSFASGGSVPGLVGEARRARTVRDAMFMMQRAGQLLRVEWGSMVRFGFIADFQADHDREEDIRWEVTFKWIGDTVATPSVLKKPRLDVPGLLARLLALVQAFLNQVNAVLALIYGAVQLVTQRIRKIGSLITGFLEALNRMASLVFVPAEMFGVLKQQLTSIILAVRDLRATLARIPQAYSAAKSGATASEQNAAVEASQAISFNARKLGVEAAETREQLREAEESDILGVVQVRENITLRDIATDFYGAPDDWTIIADFNGLSSSIVQRGTTVHVPKRQQGVGSNG
jgi:hypothetical protein